MPFISGYLYLEILVMEEQHDPYGGGDRHGPFLPSTECFAQNPITKEIERVLGNYTDQGIGRRKSFVMTRAALHDILSLGFMLLESTSVTARAYCAWSLSRFRSSVRGAKREKGQTAYPHPTPVHKYWIAIARAKAAQSIVIIHRLHLHPSPG